MLKRLSYPLSWVEGLTGESGSGKSADSDSAPNTSDSSQSVFSKVFSRYVPNSIIKLHFCMCEILVKKLLRIKCAKK
jgi:ABC-type dipeptide/oligopeptide/nickel transport system ATPase component